MKTIQFAIFIVVGILINSLLTAQVFDPVKWSFSSESLSDNTFEITFTASIEENWHMYGTKLPDGGPIATSINFNSSDNFKFDGELEIITKPETKFDKSFEMDLELHNTKAVFKQKIIATTNDPFRISGYVEFMSCDDERCLPPKEADFSIDITPGTSTAMKENNDDSEKEKSGFLTAAPENPSIDVESIGSEPEVSAEDPMENLPESTYTEGIEPEKNNDNSIWGILLLSMIAGLAGLLTPCVYPMIPMTVSFFMQGERSRSRAVFEGLFFGISIIAVYTLIGLLVGFTGSNFTTAMNTHWIPNLIFFGLFVAFALSFFGLFEIVLPSGLANRFDQQADKGGLLGPFFMALTTVIVSFSCTGPIVGSLLVKAVQGEILEPVVGMFGFGLVFALPFTLFAIFPNMLKSLPKSGGWLNAVKVVLGFIILAFALKFISNIDQAYHLNILSRHVFISIWIVLFGFTGVYLVGGFKLSHDSPLPHVGVTRLIFAIAAFSFMVYLIPGLFGAPLKGISSFLPPQESSFTQAFGSNQQAAAPNELCSTPTYADKLHLPHGLQGYFVYEEGLACAKEQNKPLFLDFKGHFCSNCKKMESEVWSDPAVLEKLRNEFIIVALYTDDKTKLSEEQWFKSDIDEKIKKTLGKVNEDFQIQEYGTNSIPLYAIVDHEGDLLTDNTYGYDPNISKFLQFLNSGIENFNNPE